MNDDNNILKPWYDEFFKYDYGEANNTLKRHDQKKDHKWSEHSPYKEEEATPTPPATKHRLIEDKHRPIVGESPSGVEVITMAEMTAAIRMALRKERPFSMVDTRCNDSCKPWFEEQKRKGLKDLALICNFIVADRPEILSGSKVAIICWYADGSTKKVTTRHDLNAMKLVINETPLANITFKKPDFLDNIEDFRDALLDIAQVARGGAPTDYWEKHFLSAAETLESNDCEYEKLHSAFYLPKPYYKYLMAICNSKTGMGMGSWYDLLIVGERDFKIVTAELAYQQFRALLYAVNNC